MTASTRLLLPILDEHFLGLDILWERREASLFDSGNMDEYILAAIIWCNETEAFCRIEKFNCSVGHILFFLMVPLTECE